MRTADLLTEDLIHAKRLEQYLTEGEYTNERRLYAFAQLGSSRVAVSRWYEDFYLVAVQGNGIGFASPMSFEDAMAGFASIVANWTDEVRG